MTIFNVMLDSLLFLMGVSILEFCPSHEVYM